MFNLAGMFVEITAKDSAVNTSLDKLKAKAEATSNAVRAKLADAFTARTAPILDDGPVTESLEKLKGKVAESSGNMFTSLTRAFSASVPFVGPLITKCLELSGVLDENNDDFKALNGVVEAVVVPIKNGITFVVHAAREWIEATVKAVKENALLNLVVEKSVELFNYLVKTVSPIIAIFTNMYTAATKAIGAWAEGTGIAKAVTSAMEVFLDYAYDGFENLKVAIDQAAHLFWVLKDAVVETLEPLPKYLKGVYNDFMNTFGDPGLDAVQAWGTAIQTWVVDKIELVGIFVRNWPDFFQIAYLTIADYLASIGEAMMTIPANAAIIGNYIANNWLKYFTDVGTNIQALFGNLVTNLQSIWTAFQDWVNGKGFHPQFTDLTKGMVSTVDALPELVKPALDAHIARLKEIADIEERIGDKVYAKHKASATAAGVEEKKKDAAVGGDFTSQSFGIADFFARQRQLTFSDSKEEKELARKALAEAEKTRKAAEKTAELLGKGIVAKAGSGK